jgi:hypothetical protein
MQMLPIRFVQNVGIILATIAPSNHCKMDYIISAASSQVMRLNPCYRLLTLTEKAPQITASVTSFTVTASATSSTVPATVTSFTMTSFTLPAAATASTVPVVATSFTLSVSNSYNEGPSEAKNKCSVAKICGIKLETKQLKRRWEQIDSHKGDRGHNVSQPRSPMLFRHKHIKRRDETQYILPDVCVAYSSRAVTYLSEVGLSDGYCNLPLARRRKFCQYAKS